MPPSHGVKSFIVINFLVMILGVVGCADRSAAPLGSPVIAVSSEAPPVIAQTAQREPTTSQTATKPQSPNWPGFRGPTGMGVGAATGLPVEWSETENLAWKTPLPGPGASSPIVFGNRIYLTCYTGYFIPDEPDGNIEDLKRHLLAIDKSDGRIVWDKAVSAKLPEEPKIRDHGFAANTPAADAERIYVFFGKSGVFAFDHEGRQQWQADVGEKTHVWGTSASPVLYEDLAIINASVESESLIALDRVTGKEKWKAGGIRESWNTPVIITAESGRKELIVAMQGAVLSFDPKSGKQLWSCKTDIGWYMVPGVVAADGIVYCLGGRSGVAALAVRAGGSGDVTETHRLWTTTKGANVPSPVIHAGHLYWPHESGIANCALASNGEIVYQQRLERAGEVYASALLADGKLYYLSRNGRTFVIAAKPEYEQLGMNDLKDGSIFNASPAIDGSRLLIRSDKFLYSIGR